MISKKFICPQCKAQVSCQGNPGDHLLVECANCGQKGTLVFHTKKLDVKRTGNSIEVKNLTKYYGKIRGIEDLTFSVKAGEIFGFLGPNGAGKTTTIRTLLGYLKPTGGKAYIFGRSIEDDIVEIKRNVGYIPGDLNLYGHLTGRQFLNYFMSLRDTNPSLLDELLSIFDVPLDRKIKGYSKGMRQKLGIIQAFMDDPDMVIMDYDFLKREKKRGKTLFFSSHVLSEVDKICDRVGIIREGKLVALEDMETLKNKKGKVLRVKIKEKPEAFEGPKDMKIKDGWIQFVVSENINYWIKQLAKYTIVDLEISEFSLDDIFMHYYVGDHE